MTSQNMETAQVPVEQEDRSLNPWPILGGVVLLFFAIVPLLTLFELAVNWTYIFAAIPLTMAVIFVYLAFQFKKE
ncbi:hypothetical protein BK816_06760 [Boudabousia tangfeifanii]|uniref:Uncharacterized protein n=1 Tax=Boudabousia tangfeifanii TaxID=1912795 RepID=A0A1D9ML38_9ACTO|nr:hypothetical protein [Boudabousia tangfeifanii]AOZ73024.1 hypothetical protein BK816_06760 [Boudabousia tangfeifanii]